MRNSGTILSNLFIYIILCSSQVIAAGGIDVSDTRLLSRPALSPDLIAFEYANDMWVAGLDGKTARRLTSAVGIESRAHFSPDGKTIAFTGNYDGNTDVYIIPSEGGIPRRLTWHPGADYSLGFTPDGLKILFTSSRQAFARSTSNLFTMPLSGGYPTQLPIPNAHMAVYSPDGKRMAYTPVPEVFLQWKNYRGGTSSEIWIFNFASHLVEKIPQPEGNCNDTNPMWFENKIFFRSDRNGEFNIFAYDLGLKKIEQLTKYTDFPVLNASSSAGKIAYEQGGHLFLLDPRQKKSQRLIIGVAADLMELRSRFVSGPRYIRSASISPSGARAVFGYRGEIVTVPAKKGDPRNLTLTTAVHEREPSWSPDGKSIAYFSDSSGEYELHVQPHKRRGEVKRFKLKGSGFYHEAVWSPDSRKIAFADNGRTLWWIDLESGKSHKIASEYQYEPGIFGSISGNWSPDSSWIAYTLKTAAYFERVYLYSLDSKISKPVTDGLSDVSNPVFDPGGKYIYFFSSTDAGPVKHWFAMSNSDSMMTRTLYLAVLSKDISSPLAAESDEESSAKPVTKSPPSKNQKQSKTGTSIDFVGLERRIVTIPVPPGNYVSLQAGKEGEIYYLEFNPVQAGAGANLHKYDLKAKKDSVVINGINGYQISADKKKILTASRSGWAITPLQPKIKPGAGRLNLNGIQVKIQPVKEWKQIFGEAWRVNRDYFYDPGMHGVDWPQMKKKYATFLPHLSCRADLNRIIRWMCSELAVGHHRGGGGDFLSSANRVPGGLLGADFTVENNRYRFKKVYGGLNWSPELRSPLTEPGINVGSGDYLLAVNGNEIKFPDNIFRYFENTAGKQVQLKVGPQANGAGSRTVTVVPLRQENSIRNRDWVEGNLKKVDKATNGRVAYVYVPNTTNLGHIYFKRYFFPQSNKEAIIIDERYNGGGQVADYYIDILNRPYISSWTTRYGAEIKTPSASIQGPKVMLINEFAGSGGDLLPYMFRKTKLGKLIGKRTWGGLVGVLGYPVLMDGGSITAPNLAFWTEEEGYAVENEGVMPDIEVEQTPLEIIQGKDPQLEKAIEIIMGELKKNPQPKRKKPPFPIRTKKK